MPRVAVLDDYQGVALEMANWSTLPSDCQVQVFRDHLTDLATRAGHWGVSLGMCLEGKVLGILGLGRLGSKVARVGVAFDMSVIAWSQNLTAERAAQCGATLVSKDELFARSDILSIHVQLSA